MPIGTRTTGLRSLWTLALCLLPGGAAVSAPAEPSAPQALVFDFTGGLSGWTAGGDTAALRVASRADHPDRGACVELDLVGASATLRLKKPLDLSRYRTLRLDAFLPRSAAQMQVSAYFIDDEDFWYQTWPRLVPAANRWDTIEVDIRPEAGQLEPKGHSRPWGPYPARNIREVGIRIFCDRETRATVLLDNIALLPGDAGLPPQDVYSFETSGDEPSVYGRFEVTFELRRAYENPYDPAQIDVYAEVLTPGGRTVRAIGFYYQDYERRVDRKAEILIPAGPPKWKIRYCPREPGEHSYRIHIRDSDPLVLPPRIFTARPAASPGFIRVAPDKRHFEFDNGDFFYPIGHNIPAAVNPKGSLLLGLASDEDEYVEKHKRDGALPYDRYLPGMARGKENYARIWLSSWSFALEWSRQYDRAFPGLGRYNQENAWRLDYVLDKARECGVYVQLALTTFGHFRLTGRNEEGDWRWSPYNIANGGLLKDPQDFWKSPKAQEIYQRMVRYVMARYAYSTHIAAWELCNEADLFTGWKGLKPEVTAWHKQCADTIRAFDPNDHLVTTSFSQGEGDFSLLAIPEISFTSTHYYAVQIDSVLRNTVWPAKAALGKPAIMGEVGYSFRGAGPDTTERYLHACLWTTHMIPFAGAGLSWWWDYIDDRDLYDAFRPLAEFAAGEDRRGRNLAVGVGRALDASGGPAPGLGLDLLHNDTSAYFWLSEKLLIRAESAASFTPEERAGIQLDIKGFKPGDYRVEFWDTRKGGIVKSASVSVPADGVLRCPVPAFTSDIAGKVKPAPPAGEAAAGVAAQQKEQP